MVKRLLILLVFAAFCSPVMAWDQVSKLQDRIAQLEVIPQSSSLLFAVTTSALFRSTDAGKTWRQTTITGHIQIAIHPRSGKIYALAISETGGIRKLTLSLSNDSGKTFALQKSFDPFGALAPRQIFLDPFRTMRLYGVGAQGQALVSFDDGKKWRLLRTPTGYHFEQVVVSEINDDALYATGLKISGGASVLFISHDQGKTWKLLSSRPNACGPQRFFVDPFFERLLVATCDGTKTLMQRGVKTSSGLQRVTSLVSVPGSSSTLFALNDRSNNTGANLWVGKTGGSSWKMVDSLSGNITAVVVLNNQERTVFAGDREGTIYSRKLSSF
jgi:photosystem II stability/assembly factor-like uncharacterized protein